MAGWLGGPRPFPPSGSCDCSACITPCVCVRCCQEVVVDARLCEGHLTEVFKRLPPFLEKLLCQATGRQVCAHECCLCKTSVAVETSVAHKIRKINHRDSRMHTPPLQSLPQPLQPVCNLCTCVHNLCIRVRNSTFASTTSSLAFTTSGTLRCRAHCSMGRPSRTAVCLTVCVTPLCSCVPCPPLSSGGHRGSGI